MKRFLRSSLLIPLAGVVVACSDDSVVTAPRLSPDATPLSTQATALPNFKDGFEGASISSFWTTNQQYGTMALSTQQAHSGVQSLMFSSASAPSSSGPKMELSHDFPVPTKGGFSIWFYDVAPGAETLYEQISLYNSQRPDNSFYP